MSTKKPKSAKSETKAAKKAPVKKASTKKVEGKLSALDAAAKVLSESAEPMNAKSLIEAMATKGYWTSPGGQTPHATLFAAISREINVKGAGSRFAKADRGQFALNDGEPTEVKAAKKAKKGTAEVEDEAPAA